MRTEQQVRDRLIKIIKDNKKDKAALSRLLTPAKYDQDKYRRLESRLGFQSVMIGTLSWVLDLSEEEHNRLTGWTEKDEAGLDQSLKELADRRG